MDYYIGIDVGTGSARAGLFDVKGNLLADHAHEIQIWHPQPDFVEQSSEDIWQAICICVRSIMQASHVPAEAIKGLGFDATCSLVLVDSEGAPVTVSPTQESAQNVIVWMDHRAIKESEHINAIGEYPAFDYVGGQISPEMQTPKLLWLKRHMRESWRQAAHFFDLPDYLTYRATGETSRSVCSTACKWTYLAHLADAGRNGWDADFFRAIGLGELPEEDFRRIGQTILPVGEPVGKGLCPKAAQELGLLPGIAVGTSIIDAHAGGIGMIGMALPGDDEANFDERLALIGGTSSCHMAVSSEARLIPGVWGPYKSAMVQDMWLNEGGQSATGSLVDHVIFQHAASKAALSAAENEGMDIYQFLNHRLELLAGEAPMQNLTRDLHVCPYFHGNRSPRANPHLYGMISGLRLSATIDDLARLYLATVQAIAYGTRHIIESMNARGFSIRTILCCGGGSKNPVFLQTHADVTGCQLIIPAEPEAVLLGAAMLGTVANKTYSTLDLAMQSMSQPGKVILSTQSAADFHTAKYRIFHRLHEDQVAYNAIMNRGIS